MNKPATTPANSPLPAPPSNAPLGKAKFSIGTLDFKKWAIWGSIVIGLSIVGYIIVKKRN